MFRSLFLSAALIGFVGCSDGPSEDVATTAAQKEGCDMLATSDSVEIGGTFTLTNQDGELVTEQDFLGQPLLIYFGFSYCPDVCPTALQNMRIVQDSVDPDASLFTPIFISVDPERDTPENLKVYVQAEVFPRKLVGLTGTQAQIDAAKAAYKVYSQKVDDPDSAAGYTIDHASLIFVMDAKGAFVDVFTHATDVQEMIRRLNCLKPRLGA